MRACATASSLRGPGNLCRGLAIGPEFGGIDLLADRRLHLAGGEPVRDVGVSARIGITKAAEVPWRFYARGSRSLSGPRALSP